MDRYKKISKVLWIILIANLFVATLKIVVGQLIGSVSLVADGYHSLTDGTSNVVGLIGVKFASKPADSDHPYGHKKFETLCGMFIGFMLIFLAGRIIYGTINWFINPQTPTVTTYSLIALIITLIINIFVATYEYRKGKKLNSDILVSDSIHTKSDIFVSIGVLFTLLCIKLGLPNIIDPIASIVVSFFIIHASIEIFKSTINVLVDKNIIEPEKIKQVILKFEDIKDVHEIRTRGRNDDIYVDLHILIDPQMNILDSHDLIHSVEEKLREEINSNIQLIAHIEPYPES